MRYKVSLIQDIFWTPFDVRFSGILMRLEKHKELLKLEWTVENAKDMQEYAKIWEDEIDERAFERKQKALERNSKKQEMMRKISRPVGCCCWRIY
jgi:hypothetical protein